MDINNTMNKFLSEVNRRLTEYVNGIEEKSLQAAISYALFPGGKRLRPLLLLCALEDFRCDLNSGIEFACAIEMIHTYSLIHDDLPAMDDDDFRRGKPAVHKQFSEAMAILAGDALLTDAFSLVTKSNLEPQKTVQLIALASIDAGSFGMVRGQVLDIQATNTVDTESIKMIHRHKTGNLFHACFVASGIIAGKNQDECALLADAALNFGMAFQLKDDIEDVTHKDEKEIVNFVNAAGKEEARLQLDCYRRKALEIVRKMMLEKELYHLIERII